MAAKKPTIKTKREYKGNCVTLRDKPLMDQVKAVAVRRGMDGLNLTAVVRVALKQWIAGPDGKSG